MENIFARATMIKLRFPYKGQISTEDLWDLSLEQLDEVYRKISSSIKEDTVDSLIENTSPQDSNLALAKQVVKAVFLFKKEQADKAVAEQQRKQQRQKIMALIEEKDNAALGEKSVEELRALLETL